MLCAIQVVQCLEIYILQYHKYFVACQLRFAWCNTAYIVYLYNLNIWNGSAKRFASWWYMKIAGQSVPPHATLIADHYPAIAQSFTRPPRCPMRILSLECAYHPCNYVSAAENAIW